MDLEYADDTVLMSQTAEVMNKLLRYVEEEAGKYGLRLNRDKTVRLTYNSGEPVTHRDGTMLPKAQRAEHLGSIIDAIFVKIKPLHVG